MEVDSQPTCKCWGWTSCLAVDSSQDSLCTDTGTCRDLGGGFRDRSRHTHNRTIPHPTFGHWGTTSPLLDLHTGIHLQQGYYYIIVFIYFLHTELSDLWTQIKSNQINILLQVSWSSFQPGSQLASVSPFRHTHSQVDSSKTLLGPQRASKLESRTSGRYTKTERQWNRQKMFSFVINKCF